MSKRAGAVSLIIDLAEIGKALWDLKELTEVSNELMPATLAVAEDAAHLAVLEERYRQFYEEFQLFADSYDIALKEAHQRGGR